MELVKFKEQIFNTIELFDPEIAQQLTQNLFSYFLLNRVEVTDTEVIISTKEDGKVKKINYDKGQFYAKMVKLAKDGLDLLNNDFSLTPRFNAAFNNWDVVVVISYKKPLQILSERGYNVNVYFLRQGDTFVELRPYVHKFDIKPKVNLTKKIENGKAINDVLFYGVEIVKATTGQAVCSYVESTENIKARANFNNGIFPNSPNAQDTMYLKFVLNQAYNFLKNYGENRLPDIDKHEDYSSLAPIDTKAIPANAPDPKIKKLKKLEQNTKTWDYVKKRLEEGAATVEIVKENFQIDEAEMLELKKIVSKNAVSVKVDDAEEVDPTKMVFDENDGGASNEI